MPQSSPLFLPRFLLLNIAKTSFYSDLFRRDIQIVNGKLAKIKKELMLVYNSYVLM